MKPKISTGYLTPQAKKTKNSETNRLSARNENEENIGFNEDVFQALMNCPEKKKMVLQLLALNKDAIDKYKQKQDMKSVASPVGKLKAKKKTCESPTAMLRRRALEQMNSSPSTSNRSDISRPSSVCSDSSDSSSTVPFDKVLDGVIAYVEIKSRQGEDRSAGAKEVLKLMGAQVRDNFTNDVTHVIFKDGSYTTFQKAKLLKIHLVSILWVEFSRKTMQKQNEKHYPAMRSGFDDETVICSQMHKEYEDIIREEYRRSIVQGTPLPSAKSLIDRRRTLMTPSVSNLDSSSSYKTAGEASSQEVSDREVATTNGFENSENVPVDLIMNDPDCFSEVSGPIVNGVVVEKQNGISEPMFLSSQNIDCSDMELTDIPSKSLISFQKGKTAAESDMELTKIHEKTPKNKSSKTEIQHETPKIHSRNTKSTLLFDRRKTICNSLLSSDVSTRSVISAENSTNNGKSTTVSDCASFAVPKSIKRSSRRLTRQSSNVLASEDSIIIGKNSAQSKEASTTQIDKTASAMSQLKLSSSDDGSKSAKKSNYSIRKSTSMSRLQISSESDLKVTSDHSNFVGGGSVMSSLRVSSQSADKSRKRSSSISVLHERSADPSDMSVLQVSSETRSSIRQNNSSTSSLPVSNSRTDKKLSRKNKEKNSSKFESEVVNTPEFTIRKRPGFHASQNSVSSDDSEILSPQRSVKRIVRRSNKEETKTGKCNINSSPYQNKVTESCTSKRTVSDSSNDSQVLDIIKAPTEVLQVNIIKSPLERLVNRDTQNVTTRKRVVSRSTEKQEISSISKGSRTTLGSQATQKDSSGRNLNVSRNRPETDSENTCNESGNDASDSSKGKRKLRKLYNPDDSIHIEVDDEKEREEKRNEIRKRKSDERVFIAPLDILKATTKTPPNESTSESDTNNVTPSKRTRRVNKKKPDLCDLNSSADEQKELLNEVLDRKTNVSEKMPRKQMGKSSKIDTSAKTPSRRKSTRIVQSRYKEICITPINRRSTLEFMPLSQTTSSRKAKKKFDKTKLPTIVCTKLHKADVQVFSQIVKKLGRFAVEDEVSDRTTHVVAGEPKRTINMLRAISRGCWILKFEWVLQSLEEGKWLPEEDFEVTDFSPAVQKCHLERQAFGTKYTMDVFESCPSMYVALSTNPRCSDLKELITTCKGKVVTAPRMAKIVVGQYIQQENTVCVNETWILDCITFYKKMPFKEKYLLSSKRKSLIV